MTEIFRFEICIIQNGKIFRTRPSYRSYWSYEYTNFITSIRLMLDSLIDEASHLELNKYIQREVNHGNKQKVQHF